MIRRSCIWIGTAQQNQYIMLFFKDYYSKMCTLQLYAVNCSAENWIPQRSHIVTAQAPSLWCQVYHIFSSTDHRKFQQSSPYWSKTQAIRVIVKYKSLNRSQLAIRNPYRLPSLLFYIHWVLHKSPCSTQDYEICTEDPNWKVQLKRCCVWQLVQHSFLSV